jgi:hypothetical protein
MVTLDSNVFRDAAAADIAFRHTLTDDAHVGLFSGAWLAQAFALLIGLRHLEGRRIQQLEVVAHNDIGRVENDQRERRKERPENKKSLHAHLVCLGRDSVQLLIFS